MADFDPEEWFCVIKISDLEWACERGLNFNCSFGSVFRVQHQVAVNVQNHQNTIGVEIVLRVSQELCEHMVAKEDIDNIVPMLQGLFEAVKCFVLSKDDCRCIEAFQLALGEGHIDISIINSRIGKCQSSIQIVDFQAVLSNTGDGIMNSGELSDRHLSFSKIHLFVACN